MSRAWIVLLMLGVAACAQRGPTPVAPSSATPGSATPGQPPGPGLGLPPNPMIGGAPMYPTRDIVDNLAQSPDHNTLVAALNVSGVAAALRQAGPFTLFAPTDAAFRALPAGVLDRLMRPEGQAQLTALLNAHVVAGRLDSTQLGEQLARGNGQVELTTLAGTKLTVRLNGAVNLLLRDPQGGFANIAIYDVIDANGVTHVIDKVLLPTQTP